MVALRATNLFIQNARNRMRDTLATPSCISIGHRGTSTESFRFDLRKFTSHARKFKPFVFIFSVR